MAFTGACAFSPPKKPEVWKHSRECKPDDTVVRVGNGVGIGNGGSFTVIAGPCAVEGEEQLLKIAHAVKDAGADILRGGAFKPRTSPYSFQGLGEEGLKLLAKARKETGLPVVTEVMDTCEVKLVAKFVNMIQVGSRNMQNFSLLRAVGKERKPVLLKRGMAASIDDLLMAAEYILAEGNGQVALCERGIRSFETATRNTLDISAAPVLEEKTHLPVIMDPSHATGKREFVVPLAKASLAAGADGLMVEVHCEPDEALCDGRQSLTLEQFSGMMKELRRMQGI
jgi:3-deoxy-7-phosphoheptulonate synthase